MIQDYLFFTGINILLAWSVYVVLLTGNLSFAQGAFMAIGCYAAGIMTTRYGVPLAVAVPAAMLLSSAAAVLVGFPALRVRGIYLILVTVGVTFCVRIALENVAYTGGVEGLKGMSGTRLWHLGAAIAAVGLLLFLLSRSPLQRILDAVREDDRVAASLGVNLTYVKLLAFGAGAAIAGLAGALYGHYLIFVRPDNFDILVSIFVVLYVILGGVNNMWGPLLGATVMTLLPEFIRALQDWRPTMFGVAIVVMLLLRPEGLLKFRQPSARWSGHAGR
ncbi:MAG: branched-chain amino acid ABC transporter permease [Phycisphaerae bacterium]|nr:branched-chain amino acid ABC transporter permease [Candidatus Odyssella sp.]NUQ48798.1 branched-chain amino acid ABC transporter permease [Phycisphaerae bacterium]